MLCSYCQQIIAVQKVMAFKITLLVIMISLYVNEACVPNDEVIGGENYLPCEYCNIPESDYPKEG